jgi:hypothetical protein
MANFAMRFLTHVGKGIFIKQYSSLCILEEPLSLGSDYQPWEVIMVMSPHQQNLDILVEVSQWQTHSD